MSFGIANLNQETESCLYRLYYGDKYIVAKGKTLAGSVYLIEKGYAYFLAGGGGTGRTTNITGKGQKEGSGKNTYYRKFYSYIKKNPRLEFRIDVLLEDNNGYQLLKAEQIELNKTIRDKNQLNNNITAYIPKYRAEQKMYGWISRAHVMNFKRFLKNM